MKKLLCYSIITFALILFSSFAVHKFYMGVFQINHAPEKKMLQITARLFIDDLNKALEKKYKIKTIVGTEKETIADIDLLKRYFTENFQVKVNGVSQKIIFLSKEVESGDVLICYLKIQGVDRIKTLEISNSVLIDWNNEQQNITHISVFGVKKTVLFTESSTKELLKY